MSWLSGKKSYLVAIVMGLLSTAYALDWVDDATYQTLLGVVGALGLGTLRAGVTKSGPHEP